MKFKTSNGSEFDVDLKARKAVETRPDGSTNTIDFHEIVGCYVGSSVDFNDGFRSPILSTFVVTAVENDPVMAVEAEQGNVLVYTENSAYEFNQEQKLFRRLAGHNPGTNPAIPDGDWRPYTSIEYMAVGYRPYIHFAESKAKNLSIVREIKGTFIHAPAV